MDREPTVVLVDNNQQYLDSLRYLLEKFGLQIITLNSTGQSVAEVLALISQSSADAVVTGVRNEDDRDQFDQTGIELARALAKKGTPVIVTSTSEYADDLRREGITFVNKGAGGRVLAAAVLGLVA